MPKPCALSRVGTPAHSTSAYLTHARIRFVPGWLWRGGGIGWPTVALAPILVKPMRHNASALFRATFGVAPRAAASAPGRVNLIGEHTDYNGGPVLPVATPLRTTVAVGPADAGVLELISTLDGERARIDWREGRATGWSAYLAGVMRELDTVGAAPAGAGARVAVASDVPVGAGLASSAALTVAAAKALSLLASVRLSPRQLAGVACRAEHGCGGAGCGVMDQMCAALARPGHALLLECASLAARHIPIRGRLLLVDTGTRHELTAGALNERGAAHRCRMGRRRARAAGQGKWANGEGRGEGRRADPARVRDCLRARAVDHSGEAVGRGPWRAAWLTASGRPSRPKSRRGSSRICFSVTS